MTWDGLSRKAIEVIGQRYELSCLALAEIIYRVYPDDDAARAAKLIEYREFIRDDACNELIRMGCPPSDAAACLKTIIAHQCKLRMAEGRRTEVDSAGGSSALN